MRDDLVDWIRTAVADGQTVVAATHEFEGLIEMANVALGVPNGMTTAHELPPDRAAREALLERLASVPSQWFAA